LAIKIDRLAEWIKEKGYQTSGPSIEVYSKKPKVETEYPYTTVPLEQSMPVKKK